MFNPRRYNRAPLEAEADLRLSSGGGWRKARIKNVSPAGCYVVTEQRPRLGEIVELRFRISGDDALIEARGEAVRVFGYHRARDGLGLPGVGVAFLGLAEALQEKLFHYTLDVERTLTELVSLQEGGRRDEERIEALLDRAPFLRKYPARLRKRKAAFELESFRPGEWRRSAVE